LSKATTNADVLNSYSGVNIRVEGVSVNAAITTILRDICLEIKQGEFVAILGKSGAGKSTLLRTMAGLLKPAKGRVLLNDRDFFSLNQGEKRLLRRKIGFIPQQFKLIKETSVFENVMVGRLGYQGALQSTLHLYPRADVEIVVKCINKVGLGGRENTHVKRLSGGEQQRVAIARCLAQEPVVILADEPMASLDVVLAENILDNLRSANNGGATVICVLHNIESALKYAGRIVLLDKGGMVTDTVPEKIDEYAIKKLLAD
jgi:phosphonate transport system ATP-binding protein